MRFDVLLVHPPAFMDFYSRRRYYGPIADVVPSTALFDMYPIGFLSIVTHLARHGFRVGLLNLAAAMAMNPGLDVEGLLSGLYADVYAVDLHWAIHCSGALRVAGLLKRLHPSSAVVLGGLTATIYWREVLEKYGFVDYVLLGDTCEEPLRMLVEAVQRGLGASGVPNTAYRSTPGGVPRSSGVTHAPSRLDDYSVDYRLVFRSVVNGDVNPLYTVPFAGFLRSPIAGVLPYKGCLRMCVTCGGSRYTYSRYYGRRGLGVKSPAAVASEVESLLEYMRIPVFVLNDPFMLGRGWVEGFAGEVRERGIDTSFFFEVFRPLSREELALLASVPGASVVEISPETADEELRRVFGKPYSNAELESFIGGALDAGFERVDVYFMVGVPFQTWSECVETAAYALRLAGLDPRVKPFIAPMTPFLDPGSIAFDNPSSYGYRLRARSLEEHVALVESAGDWLELMNYEHLYMPGDVLASATYSAMAALQSRGVTGSGEGFGHEGVSLRDLYESRHVLRSASVKLKLRLLAALVAYSVKSMPSALTALRRGGIVVASPRPV